MNQPKMSQIKLSPQIEEAVATFHDESMKRMAQANAADEPKEPLFHYTSESALFSIIESEKFWFTSIYHMDDKEELTFGFNVSRSLLQAAVARGDHLTRLFCEELVDEEDLKKIKTLFEFYSISFGLKDDPQQWENYGDKGRGIAIGLAPEFFHPAPVGRDRHDQAGASRGCNQEWSRCHDVFSAYGRGDDRRNSVELRHHQGSELEPSERNAAPCAEQYQESAPADLQLEQTATP
jgi:hypothetical protein